MDLKVYELQAAEIMMAMTDLARLTQRAGSAAPGVVAKGLLERLLAFCSAQRGAVLLMIQPQANLVQPPFAHAPHAPSLRALALHDIHEDEVHSLLTSITEDSRSAPFETCWITYRLPLAGVMVDSNAFSTSLADSEMTQDRSSYSPQALLVIGWTGLQNGNCATAIEQGYALLPLIADAVEAVIVNVLLAERVRNLEASAARDVQREADRLKSELIGTVNHELRSPLAAIKGYAATLLRHERRLSREERREFLSAIDEASDRLEVIVERLLEMSELEVGFLRIDRSPVDVAHLALEAIAATRERTAEHPPGRFSFTLRLEDVQGRPTQDMPLILGDPRRLREVLDNLLENAVKYSPTGGAIEVMIHPVAREKISRTRGEGLALDAHDSIKEGQALSSMLHPRQMLEISVRDKGMGIPTDHLERIFERFHRVDTRLTRDVNGLGLGLAISKRIVELHNGTIWAESEPGIGSIFYVQLPMDEMSD